ncbi:MAG: PorP/SprF family type IX secretion system membrane protein [Bacteroidota bacterium]
MRYLLSTLLFLCLTLSPILAQDAVWSMAAQQPQYLNPARTGAFNGRHRINLSHRSQWWNVLEDQAYHTQAAAYSFRFCSQGGNGYFGLGMRLYADELGTAPYRSAQAKLAGSYMHLLDQGISDAYIAIGAEIGLVQHSLDINRLSFNAQFIDGGFDPDAATGENFLTDQYQFGDFAVGLVLRRNAVEVGVNFAHILGEPRQAFLSGATEGENKPPIRTSSYLDWQVLDAKDQVYVNWEVYHFRQRKFWMLQSIVQFSYDLYNDEVFGPTAGIGLRLTDRQRNPTEQALDWMQTESLILQGGFHFGTVNLLASYDINLSGLKRDSKGFGALEISLEVLTPMGRNDCVSCPKNSRQKKRARKRVHRRWGGVK